MAHTSETRFRVRYAETDKMGVVYYANYFVWMEVGRTDYCKTVGFNYREMERDDANMAVADASCRYIAPARYDDEILVRTSIEKLNRRPDHLCLFNIQLRNGPVARQKAEPSTSRFARTGRRARSLNPTSHCCPSFGNPR
jgi:YbgC/YbaW family acyl-CoA thioester hydrolase